MNPREGLAMVIDHPGGYEDASELEIMGRHLRVVGARVLELGCGAAWMTRKLVESLHPAQVVATEVDAVQHAKNLQLDDLPQVEFRYGGAERIELEDDSMDLVIMLKSLHHVPLEQMEQALREVARVLKPGGQAYISEPVFAGELNEILRLFNDEQQVREAAFAAVKGAVAGGLLELERQIFFRSPGRFSDFAEFEQRILRVTHSNHQVDDELYHEVKRRFERHLGDDGVHFRNPVRVDLLRKPSPASA